MPLHLTKIAYGAESPATLRDWLESEGAEARLTTRYLPKRHEEMAGGSLYWIHQHAIIGRSPLLGFEQKSDGPLVDSPRAAPDRRPAARQTGTPGLALSGGR